ncbi:hypothetical protein M426DRAFT_325023 [Hypoxylon sp. CI-4A]|nr:hypothetical protein M426DRAFT_325023 [Hypoxylon sp. CI-4A]
MYVGNLDVKVSKKYSRRKTPIAYKSEGLKARATNGTSGVYLSACLFPPLRRDYFKLRLTSIYQEKANVAYFKFYQPHLNYYRHIYRRFRIPIKMEYINQRVAQEAAKDPSGIYTGLLTPLNAILIAITLYTTYLLYKPSPPATLPREPPATVFKTFTPRTLLPYNGLNDMPVYLAVRGRVFDVTSGRNFYGPGGPYENFAGRDATRGLAFHSFDEDMLTKDLDGPLDKLEGLGPEEYESLQGWEERFLSKYLVVGKLVAQADA